MIDAKIIVEAAIQNADKYNPCRSTLDREEVCRASFANGVKWFKQAIWHDISEEPELNKPIIIERYSIIRGIEYMEDINYSSISWKLHVDAFGITKWCYIEDILSKGGEE